MVKLQQIALVRLHLGPLLPFLARVHAEEVRVGLARREMFLIGWSGDLPFFESHDREQDFLGQLQVLTAVHSQYELLG